MTEAPFVGPEPDEILDVSGRECPVPASESRRRLDAMAPGQVLKVIATDPLAAVDLQILCDRCGHALLGSDAREHVLMIWIRVSPARPPGAG